VHVRLTFLKLDKIFDKFSVGSDSSLLTTTRLTVSDSSIVDFIQKCAYIMLPTFQFITENNYRFSALNTEI